MRMVICILIVIFLVQCNAYKKVASDPYRSEKEIATIAPVCAVLFPPKIEYKEGKVIVDSTAYKQLTDDVQDLLDDANDAYQQLADSAEVDKATYKERIANLETALKKLKRGIPCPKTQRVDTIFQDNPAAANLWNTRLIALQTENAEVKAESNRRKYEADEAKANKNKGWYFFAGLCMLIGVYIYLKIRFKFIP